MEPDSIENSLTMSQLGNSVNEIIQIDEQIEELEEGARELIQQALKFRPSTYKDDHRDPEASRDGGF